MRVSVPSIPHVVQSSKLIQPSISPSDAIQRLAAFLAPGNVTLLTGAGVSVDSGIRAYRGRDGRYMNPNYKPIFYHELIDDTEFGAHYRQRYWLRSYLGYPFVRDAVPNTSHYALAALQHSSIITRLITQNVDGLHHKALTSIWDAHRIQESILELHGTLRVRPHSPSILCDFQVKDALHAADRISVANPRWKSYADGLERSGTRPRTNPDGDVALDGVSYDDFVVPDCPDCLLEGRRNSIQKPKLTFFGESIPKDVRDKSFLDIERCDRLFALGTTLATHSAFRLLKHALSLQKPVLLLNVGPTRADGVRGVEKIEIQSGAVIRQVVRAILGTQAEDPVVRLLLNSGIMKPPHDDSDHS